MLRRTFPRVCSASSSSSSSNAAVDLFLKADQYKYQIAGGAAFVVFGGLYYRRSKRNARIALDQEMLTNIKKLQDEVKTANASIAKLQKDLKVSQTAILGQETTIRKLQTAAESQSTELKKVTDNVAQSVKTLETVEHSTQHELKEQRKSFAKLFASKAELDTKVKRMEGQLTRCDEVPRLKELMEEATAAKAATAAQATQTAAAEESTKASH